MPEHAAPWSPPPHNTAGRHTTAPEGEPYDVFETSTEQQTDRQRQAYAHVGVLATPTGSQPVGESNDGGKDEENAAEETPVENCPVVAEAKPVGIQDSVHGEIQAGHEGEE